MLNSLHRIKLLKRRARWLNMDLSRILKLYLSLNLWFTTNITSPSQFSKRLKRQSKCLIGGTFSLMSITKFSMKLQELRENLAVLIINNGIKAGHSMPLRAFKPLYHVTLEVSTIGIILVIFHLQTQTAMRMKWALELSPVSLSWDNGRSIGAKDTIFLPVSISSGTIKMEDLFSIIPLITTLSLSLPRTSPLKWFFQKVPPTSK